MNYIYPQWNSSSNNSSEAYIFQPKAWSHYFPNYWQQTPLPHLSDKTTTVMTRRPGFRWQQPCKKQHNVSASSLHLPSPLRSPLLFYLKKWKKKIPGLLLPAAFLISFVIAVFLGHTHWGWPYISDTTTMWVLTQFVDQNVQLQQSVKRPSVLICAYIFLIVAPNTWNSLLTTSPTINLCFQPTWELHLQSTCKCWSPLCSCHLLH